MLSLFYLDYGQLSVLGEGNIFGDIVLVDNLPRSASAVAVEDNTRVLEKDHALFVYLVGQQPAFALIILKALSFRLRKKAAQLELPDDTPARASAIPADSRAFGIME
jgi:CRP-like cAMP-binding protein